MVLVGTSTWIKLHRCGGDPAVKLAVRGLLGELEAALCGPVEMEYLGGARPAERERLQAWCNILPYIRNDQKIWRKAAANFSLLKQKGLSAPWNDVLIAIISIENRVPRLCGGQALHGDGTHPESPSLSAKIRRDV